MTQNRKIAAAVHCSRQGHASSMYYDVMDESSGLLFDDDVENGETSLSQFDINEHLQTVDTFNFRGQSRAETAMNDAYRHEEQSEIIPSDFKQKFHVENGVSYPCHPYYTNRYSKYPSGFRGCFFCGERHARDTCPQTHRDFRLFHFELNCHRPDSWFKFKRNQQKIADPDRKRKADPQRNPGYELREARGRGRGRAATEPAWKTSSQRFGGNYYGSSNDSRGYQPETEDRSYSAYDYSKAPSFVLTAKTFSFKENKLRRMPITTQNELPHISFPIGNTTQQATVLALYDTGGALNSGNLNYHRDVIKRKMPAVVHSFEQFDGSNPFDPIKLCGALIEDESYSQEKHGILSAVIRYNTPFKHQDGTPVLLSFALGVDMSVDSIIGIPFLREIDLNLRIRLKEFVSHELKLTFPCTFRETRLTIPKIEKSLSEKEKSEINKQTQKKSADDNVVSHVEMSKSLHSILKASSQSSI